MILSDNTYPNTILNDVLHPLPEHRHSFAYDHLLIEMEHHNTASEICGSRSDFVERCLSETRSEAKQDNFQNHNASLRI